MLILPYIIKDVSDAPDNGLSRSKRAGQIKLY
jgi:hypothetical protein